MAAPTLTCGRCRETRPTVPLLEAHLVHDHLMGAAQAQREARQARVSTRKVQPIAPPEAEAPNPEHVCPTCQTRILCDWQSVAELEQQAHRLSIVAGVWKARLRGVKIGKPRINTFDVDEARRLVLVGMSYRAAAETLGATSASAVERAMARAPRTENGHGR